MLLRFFHSSPRVFCSVNFGFFNEGILLLSAEPVAPVSCWNYFSLSSYQEPWRSGRFSGQQ